MTKRCLILILCIFALLLLLPALCPAELSEMNSSQMAEIHGHGATNLYIEGNTVRLFLDVHMETYGEIDSAKAAYYDKGGTYNWDMNWTDLTLGESMNSPLVTDGLVLRTEFDDISAPGKQLERIIIGTNHMSGRISGTFTTTTGAVNPSVVGGTGDPIVMNRGTDMRAYDAMDLSDTGFFIDINFDGNSAERGVKTIIGYPESQAVNFTFSGQDWWQ